PGWLPACSSRPPTASAETGRPRAPGTSGPRRPLRTLPCGRVPRPAPPASRRARPRSPSGEDGASVDLDPPDDAGLDGHREPGTVEYPRHATRNRSLDDMVRVAQQLANLPWCRSRREASRVVARGATRCSAASLALLRSADGGAVDEL